MFNCSDENMATLWFMCDQLESFMWAEDPRAHPTGQEATVSSPLAWNNHTVALWCCRYKNCLQLQTYMTAYLYWKKYRNKPADENRSKCEKNKNIRVKYVYKSKVLCSLFLIFCVYSQHQCVQSQCVVNRFFCSECVQKSGKTEWFTRTKLNKY